MRKIILASHGLLAKGMLNSAQMVTGPQEHIRAYGLEKGSHPDNIAEEIKALIEKDNNKENDYVIVTDIIGGSVHTSLSKLCVYKNVYIVSGMNLALILGILLYDDTKNTKEIIHAAMANAKESIVFSDFDKVNEFNEEGGESSIW